MEQSPSASQETLHVLWKPKVHYRFYKDLASVSILNQINPILSPHVNTFHARSETGYCLLITVQKTEDNGQCPGH
jgi:hypothetical protein